MQLDVTVCTTWQTVSSREGLALPCFGLLSYQVSRRMRGVHGVKKAAIAYDQNIITRNIARSGSQQKAH